MKRNNEVKSEVATTNGVNEVANNYISATKESIARAGETIQSMAERDGESHVGLADVGVDLQDVSAEQVNVLATSNGTGTVGVKNAHIGRVKANVNLFGLKFGGKDDYSSDKVDPSLTLAADENANNKNKPGRELPDINENTGSGEITYGLGE